MLREIAFDTETTGLDPDSGHRIIELGCVEMIDKIRTGRTFHRYLNPARDVPEEATRVHGITTEFLLDKPMFAEVVDDFLEFIADSTLVIHNAGFDMKFINAELNKVGFKPLPMDRALDTVIMARRKFPGAPASLDALCRRFEIDLSARTKHGALLDAELLSDVYLELCGGRQAAITFESKMAASENAIVQQETVTVETLAPRAHAATPDEEEAHKQFLAKLKNALWLQEPQDAK